jgi:hypothetical protein
VSGLTRRQFGGGAVATIAVLGTAGVIGLGSPFGGSGPQAFALEHSDRVKVWFGNGERFTMKVIERSTGRVLQHETDLDVGRLLKLESDHVRIHRTEVPSA